MTPPKMLWWNTGAVRAVPFTDQPGSGAAFRRILRLSTSLRFLPFAKFPVKGTAVNAQTFRGQRNISVTFVQDM